MKPDPPMMRMATQSTAAWCGVDGAADRSGVDGAVVPYIKHHVSCSGCKPVTLLL